jgi:putative ABC transport system permease protein
VPDYKNSTLKIYLEKDQDTAEFIQAMEIKYKDVNCRITNYEESIDNFLLSFRSAMTIFCIACISITVLTISLILFLLIKIKLLKEQKQLGISKALGYSTMQLISHVIVSFLPIVLLGSIFGSILSIFLVNPALELLLVGSGIIRCEFIINKLYVLLVPIGIGTFAFLTIIMVASRIRKITPCELFTGE